jgi:transcriptional regulator of acetoin/glycerol metabolism
MVAVGPEVMTALQAYPWPGNVRELRNVIERALVLGEGPQMILDDLPPELLHARPVGARVQPSTIVPLAELERGAIEAALQATAGNKARAAALLGIDRTTLYRKLKETP